MRKSERSPKCAFTAHGSNKMFGKEIFLRQTSSLLYQNNRQKQQFVKAVRYFNPWGHTKLGLMSSQKIKFLFFRIKFSFLFALYLSILDGK